MPESQYAVELVGITKRFPGVVANSDIHLRVRRGEVHALCGENGAGKSTLMKILYGIQPPDEGTITVDGAPVRFRSPADAIKAGIGMVHQHFMLADNLTVAENILLGAEALHGIGGAAKARITELARTVGLDVRPDVLVERLGVADRQRVEIVKVLYRGARTIILDEPTAVLVPQEVDDLFATLRGMRADGYTFVFISHKLDEVRAIADTITVIRRGTSVGTADPRTVTTRRLAEMMVGSELPSPETRDSTVTDREVLRVAGLQLAAEDAAGGGARPLLDGIDLVVRAGEVLGIAGVEGNGQTELVETIMGLRRAAAGTITLSGTDITRASTLARREAGIGYVPEDRTRHGILGSQPLWENRMLGHQSRKPINRGGPLGLLDRAAARRDTERIVAEFDVRTPGIDVAAAALSGGNQQKLVVGRELSGDPVLLIASHPTRGVDVGAQAAIWEVLRTARARGLAVLLVSADLDELIGLSDTIRVMLRGRLVADADPATVTPEELGAAMTGADGAGPHRSGPPPAGPPPVGSPPVGSPPVGSPPVGSTGAGSQGPGPQPAGSSPHAAGPQGAGPRPAESHGSGSHPAVPPGSRSSGSGPQGPGPQGAGPQGAGPQGAGPQGSGPQGAGSQGSGSHPAVPPGSRPQGPGGQGPGPRGAGSQGSGAHPAVPPGPRPQGPGPRGPGTRGPGSPGAGPQGPGPRTGGPQGPGPRPSGSSRSGRPPSGPPPSGPQRPGPGGPGSAPRGSGA